MFLKIYTYELKYWLKKTSTYIYFSVFFVFALLTILGTGGFFDEPSTSQSPIQLLNSPHEINYIFQYFNKFFLFLLPAIIGTTLYKDYQGNFHNILYSFPIQKSSYVFGKFLSAFTVVLFIVFSVGLAFVVGEWILGANNPKIGPFNGWGYLHSYAFFVIPNMLIYGLLVFVVVGVSRNIYAGFTTIILLVFLQIITENLFVGHPFLIAISDPFAQNAAMYETQYWTLSEQNTKLIPVWSMVLYNRLFWLSISITLVVIFYRKFSFTQEPISLPFKRKTSKIEAATSIEAQKSTDFQLSNVEYNFSTWQQIKAIFKLSAIDFKYIVKSWMFLILVVFGIFAILFTIGKVTNTGELVLLPLTSLMLSVPMFFFSTIIILITFIFSGMLVHRARMSKSHQLIDATSLPNWVFIGSKILAIIQVQFILLMVMLLCGIAIQVYNGFYDFEVGLYLFHLFVLTFPTLIIWTFASIFIHTLFPNLYLGIFLLLLTWVGKDQLSQIGIHTHLFQFNTPPQLQYSSMNGFGSDLAATFLIHAYWLAFSGLLVISSHLLWKRGFTFSFKERVQIAVTRLKGFVPYAAMTSAILMLILGFKIFQGESYGSFDMNTNKSQENILTHFKKNYEQYKITIQPKITDVKLNIELFPDSKSFQASGKYTIVNSTSKNIDTLLIKTGFDEITSYTINQHNVLISRDSILQFAVHLLKETLLPNDSLVLHFDIKNKSNTVFERNSGVLQNGTFLKSDILPRLGYFLDNDNQNPNDSTAAKVNFYSIDADLIDLETTISTSDNQIAIAPGFLQRKWTENSRNYYHYQTDQKIKFLFAFNSGVFSLQKEYYKGILLEVYHHPTHNFNTSKMMDGLKAAIDYNTQYFSTYQHKEARIIEFPLSEGTYATTMANSIPISEIRFILNPQQSEDKIDLSFYVPAHELTHQWFGNQLIPANALGAKMLTESITEYISLKMYEDYYGKEKALEFLKFQRKRYLRGRTQESETESPLYLVSTKQEYIAYGKGSMAFNTLNHYLGEEQLNIILKYFLEHYQFRTNKYPTTIDLIEHLKKATPTELQYLITDFFETVTFYENKIKDVQIVSIAGNVFEAVIDFEVRKYRGDEEETFIPLNDFIEIGCYNADGVLFAVEKIKVTSPSSKHTLVLNQNPSKVMLDPNYLVMDKNMKDNEWKID
ncbi:MAG: M1 family aminopeptidase [Chitinophagales bacterium]